MLTIFLDDLRHRPIFEIQRIASFAGFKASPEDIISMLGKYPAVQSVVQTRGSPTVAIANWATIAANTLQTEMDWSKNLSRWPCKNFKELEMKKVVLPHRRFFMVSANCSVPYVRCTVNYDLREQKDDKGSA